MPQYHPPTFSFKISLLAWALALCAAGCGKSDKDRVDELQVLLTQKQFRALIRTYEGLNPPLESPEELARARQLYDSAYHVVSQSLALVSAADSLASIGFAPEAYKKYTLAMSLEPTETTIVIKRNAVPAQGRPVYRWAGTLGPRDFSLTYHTKWDGTKLLPETVEIQVTNHHPTSPVLMVGFVPFISYMEVDGYHLRSLLVYFDPYRQSDPIRSALSKPLWRNNSASTTLSYSRSQIAKNNPALSYSDVFTRIMLGNDEACYIYLLGYRGVQLRGFDLVGYD
jgi:hypothetical protein